MSVSAASALPHPLAAAGDGSAGIFGTDPWWLVIVKVVAIFAFLVVIVLFMIWWERKLVGWMQQRIGPDRVGPHGILQSLADGIKLGLKEAVIPKAADLAVYLVAPVVAVIPAFLALSVIPFGPVVSIGGHQTSLQLTDLPVGVLVILATSSIGIYGIVLAGWSSGSTYPLLGALRSSAQMISYEVAMGLSLVAVFMAAGTMSTSGVVAGQQGLWYGIELAPSFVIYAISMVGETNRAPFDLPEAEGELVGGYHTEYSSMKFAMFFLAEYVNMVTVSALATTLFLGGWRAPWPLSVADNGVLNTSWYPLVWFMVKLLLLLCVFVWLRGTLPRLRYDQFMRFGWKVLIPISLVWILLVAFIRVADEPADQGGLGWGGDHLWIPALVIAAVLLILLVFGGEKEAPEKFAPPVEFDPMAHGFPVPPKPGQRLPQVRRRSFAAISDPPQSSAPQSSAPQSSTPQSSTPASSTAASDPTISGPAGGGSRDALTRQEADRA